MWTRFCNQMGKMGVRLRIQKTVFNFVLALFLLFAPTTVYGNSRSSQQNLQGQRLLSSAENDALLREDFFRYELKISEEKIQIISQKQKQYLQRVLQFDELAARGELDALPSKFLTIRNYQNWLRHFLGAEHYELLLKTMT